MPFGLHEQMPQVMLLFIPEELGVRDAEQLVFIDDPSRHRHFAVKFLTDDASSNQVIFHRFDSSHGDNDR
jgi:hypothetical protein